MKASEASNSNEPRHDLLDVDVRRVVTEIYQAVSLRPKRFGRIY